MKYGIRERKRACFFYRVLLASLLFSGCSHHRKDKTNKHINGSSAPVFSLDHIIQLEAMLLNIPLPLYNERIILDDYIAADGAPVVALGYKSLFNREEAIDFFVNEMERYGWKLITSFIGVESILQFKNPESYCTIVIKVLNENCSSVFIYTKRASNKCSLNE